MYALHDSGSRIPHSSLHSLNIMNVCMYVQLLSHSLTTPSSYRYHISSLWTLCTTQHHSTDPSIHPSIHPFIHLPTYLFAYLPTILTMLSTYTHFLSSYLPNYSPTNQPIIHPPTTNKDAPAEVNYHHQCCSWWHGYNCGCCDAAVHTL